MIRHLPSLLALWLMIQFTACQSIHRGIPRGERHARRDQVIIDPVTKTPVTATRSQEEKETENATAFTNTDSVSNRVLNTISEPVPQQISDHSQEQAEILRESAIAPMDTLFIDENILREEKNALTQMTVGVVFTYLGFILFPLYVAGLIAGFTAINKYNNLQFITEKGLRRKKRMRIALIIGAFVPLFALLLTIGILVAFS